MNSKILTLFMAAFISFSLSANVYAADGYYQPDEHDDYITQVCGDYGLDKSLVKAVIQVESSWNIYAESSYGCIGLMQISPKWHKERCERLGFTTDDLTNGDVNILVGCDYLKELIDGCDGCVPLALMAYNQGMRGAKETYDTSGISAYAQKILNLSGSATQTGPAVCRAKEGKSFADPENLSQVKHTPTADAILSQES